MTHRHVQDTRRRRKPCLEISAGLCLSRTTSGFLLHFDPPAEGSHFRQVGGFDVDPGPWTLVSGSFDTGDLTVRPSIRISTTRSGKPVELLHGWIRNGKWVGA